MQMRRVLMTVGTSGSRPPVTSDAEDARRQGDEGNGHDQAGSQNFEPAERHRSGADQVQGSYARLDDQCADGTGAMMTRADAPASGPET